LYEDAIEGQGMLWSMRHQRWTIPPKTGISRLLDEDQFFDHTDRKGGDDDDDGDAEEGTVGNKTKKTGTGGPRKSTRVSMAAGTTLGDALADLDMEGDEGMEQGEGGEDDEVEGEGGEDDGESRQSARPTKVSPAWCAVYGQYMLSSQSHHGALCEYSLSSYFLLFSLQL
jgi:hypothetical protein